MSALATLGHSLTLLLGGWPKGGYVASLYSVRLDESGTDGRSAYTTVAGAVGLAEQWEALETKWGNLLRRSEVAAFHTKEFRQREGDFKGWSDFKAKRFVQAQEKILKNATWFEVAVAIENAPHNEIKREMRGIHGYKPDSHYGMCFRVAMILTCQKIMEFEPDARVAFMVEDGPWAGNAATIYSDVKRTAGAKYRASFHAHMLAGFLAVPKGDRLSLEAADYLAGRAQQAAERDKFTSTQRRHVAAFMDRDFLRDWHGGMLREKEHRRSHGTAKKKQASLAERSS